MTTQQMLETALRHHQAGRLAQAEASYLELLAREPDDAPALHWLAMVKLGLGKSESALEHIERAVALRPQAADIQQARGIILGAVGRLDDAIAAFGTSVELEPSTLGFRNLAVAFIRKGNFADAIHAAQQAIAASPQDSESRMVLGDAFYKNRQFSEAAEAFSNVIAVDSKHSRAYDGLGNCLQELGIFDRSITAHLRAVALSPSPITWSNLGNAYKRSGNSDQAIAAYQSALQLQPDTPDAHNNLGVCLADARQWDRAIAAYRRAISLRPGYAEAHYNLANALGALNQFDQAIEQYRAALELRPDFASASGHLASAYKDVGRVEEAIAASRRAIAGQPENVLFHSNHLFLLRFDPNLEPDQIYQEHRQWNQAHALPLASEIRALANDPSPERRLRIGYVSPDFRMHSVAFFFESLAEFHDPSQVEIFCYSNVAKPDVTTQRLRHAADHWLDITHLSDADVAAQIRKDEIDILVDLAGHTSGTRLLIFARKPAPIQVTYLGYPDTTGLTAIDYRITDAIADPPGKTEQFHSEQLIRLPHAYACYRPPDNAPAVGPLSALSAGHVTFAAFTVLAKLSRPVLQTWAAILSKIPGSRLLFVATGLDDASISDRFRQPFADQNISPDRLTFLGYQLADQYLAMHHRADILLDTFPVNGHTTTCHALWMGLPVITLAGKTCCQRLGASVLHNLNLGNLVADSAEQYVQIAENLSQNLPELAELRTSLRRRMRESDLMDGRQFARDMENIFRTIWKNRRI
jgi:protein O-GlcNAc transferase